MQTGVERNLPAEQRRVEKVEFRGKGVKKNEKQKNYCSSFRYRSYMRSGGQRLWKQWHII